MACYFDTVDPEARSVYTEWSQLPTEDALERQQESIERVMQPPDYDPTRAAGACERLIGEGGHS